MSIRKLGRREFLRASGRMALATALPTGSIDQLWARDIRADDDPTNSQKLQAAYGVLRDLIGTAAEQINLRMVPERAAERFAISGAKARIVIEGTSLPSILAGVNWYLRYVANVSITWSGDCLSKLLESLPAPPAHIERRSNVRHRFALNDTNNGYTGPYWQWDQWKHFLDVLALHGINEVLMFLGAEAVYQKTFRAFGFTEHELRSWFPSPAHQPWWLLQNMSSWEGRELPQTLIDDRLALGRRVCDYLRSLDIVPVLPGYCGMVPDGFTAKQPGARVLSQGNWQNLKRPDWLDPATEEFARVAAQYYKVQEELLGPSMMYKMDPLHEGGSDAGLNIAAAAAGIEMALQKTHPGATWAILGWQNNPRPDLLSGIHNKEHALILDGASDRYAFVDRNIQWPAIPYAFGSIWNFGGHTTMGANMEVWNDRYFRLLHAPNSKLNGIAIMPEAACNNPVAFEFLAELAWHDSPVDLGSWFTKWSSYRYGYSSAQAAKAWNILHRTAYAEPSGEWSESHDNLFSATPDLSVCSSASWSPKAPRYNLKSFSRALIPLLEVPDELTRSSAYQYDLVDVARQVIADQSRWMLPEIKAAFLRSDLERFRVLTASWLDHIEQLNQIAGTQPSLLLGKWVADVAPWAKTENERAQLEFDARSLLVQWGPVASQNSGIHDYANREWNGLLLFYRERWRRYFAMLEACLRNGEAVSNIDWFAMEEEWSKRHEDLPVQAQGNALTVVKNACAVLGIELTET